MLDGERNEIFVVFFLFWIKQKRQNKDVLASKVKVAGKQTLHLTSMNLKFNKEIPKVLCKGKNQNLVRNGLFNQQSNLPRKKKHKDLKQGPV